MVQQLLTFGIAGLVAQLIDGTLGMAYGVTATTLLVTMGTTAAVASATVHLAEIGTTFVSGAAHWRFGNVDWRIVRLLGAPGAVGAFVGATVLSNLDGSMVEPIVAVILLVLGAYVVARFVSGRRPEVADPSALRPGHLAPLGLVAGFIDAIGGGGWGPVTSPTLIAIGRQEPRTAIGSVSASEFLVAVAASVGFLASLGTSGISGRAVAALLAGGVIAAPLAAWLVSRIRSEIAGALVGTTIVLVNARTLLSAADVAGPTRAVVLTVIVAVGAVLTVRVAWRGRRRPGRVGVPATTPGPGSDSALTVEV